MDFKIKKIFINHTNHASKNWTNEQRQAAQKFGNIIDVPFPDINANWTEKDIYQLVNKNAKKIIELNPVAVLCQGEFNYTYAMINLLKKNNIIVLAATSERKVIETIGEDGSTQRTSSFNFVQFRKY